MNDARMMRMESLDDLDGTRCLDGDSTTRVEFRATVRGRVERESECRGSGARVRRFEWTREAGAVGQCCTAVLLMRVQQRKQARSCAAAEADEMQESKAPAALHPLTSCMPMKADTLARDSKC